MLAGSPADRPLSLVIQQLPACQTDLAGHRPRAARGPQDRGEWRGSPHGDPASWRATSPRWRRSTTTFSWSATCLWWGIWCRASVRLLGAPCSPPPAWPARVARWQRSLALLEGTAYNTVKVNNRLQFGFWGRESRFFRFLYKFNGIISHKLLPVRIQLQEVANDEVENYTCH